MRVSGDSRPVWGADLAGSAWDIGVTCVTYGPDCVQRSIDTMPELPEVETIRRGLAERLSGQTITGLRVRQAQLRHLVDVAALQEHAVGRTITRVDRRAKYLLVRLQPDYVLVLHLGMTGRLWVGPPADQDAPHDHLIFSLGPELELRFHDTRRFGMCFLTTEVELLQHPRLRHLGPEPFSEAFPVPISSSVPRDSTSP